MSQVVQPTQPVSIAPETKRARFLRVAPDRVQRAIRALESIGRLAGSPYESETHEQVQMFEALLAALEEAQARFEPKPQGSFSFKPATEPPTDALDA